MIDGSLYLAFLVTVFVLVVTPGPDMMFIIAVGARDGPGAGFVAAIGVAVGLGVHTAAAVLGLSALFTAFPPLHDAMRWIGAVYLIYLAVRAFRTPLEPAPAPALAPVTAGVVKRQAFRRALIINLLNPKVILFNAAFLPQFVNPALGQMGLQFLVLGLTFVAVDLAVDGPIGLASGRLGKLLARHRLFSRGLTMLTGTIFAGLAARLVLVRE